MAGLTRQGGTLTLDGGAALTWAVAGRPIPGEDASGDRHLVLAPPDGPLLAVVDGLGHGPEAAEVAERAVAAIGAQTGRVDVIERMAAGDRALAGTRGAVAALVSVEEPAELAWAGVGNVEAVLLRAAAGGRMQVAHALASTPGILGARRRSVHVSRCSLRPGDVLVMATDGVDTDLAAAVSPGGDLGNAVEGIVRTWAKRSDDALVLAARYEDGT